MEQKNSEKAIAYQDFWELDNDLSQIIAYLCKLQINTCNHTDFILFFAEVITIIPLSVPHNIVTDS